MTTNSVQQEAINALTLLDEYDQERVLDYIHTLAQVVSSSHDSQSSRPKSTLAQSRDIH